MSAKLLAGIMALGMLTAAAGGYAYSSLPVGDVGDEPASVQPTATATPDDSCPSCCHSARRSCCH